VDPEAAAVELAVQVEESREPESEEFVDSVLKEEPIAVAAAAKDELSEMRLAGLAAWTKGEERARRVRKREVERVDLACMLVI